jgi:hypothetical protein
MSILAQEIAVAIALFGGLLLLIEAGFWIGCSRPRTERKEGQIGVVLGAMLGLLGLLLGFSYSGTTQRFSDREDGVVREANAIRTAYFRADVLADADARARLRDEIREYAAERLRLFETLDEAAGIQVQERLHALHQNMWNTAILATSTDQASRMPVLQPINDIRDLLELRKAVVGRKMPGLALALLITCAAVTIAGMGFACGLTNDKQRMIPRIFAVLVAAALWVTIDVDHPRAGLLKMSGEPLREVAKELQAKTTPK